MLWEKKREIYRFLYSLQVLFYMASRNIIILQERVGMTEVTDLSTVIAIPIIGDTAAAVVYGGVSWHILLRLYARRLQSIQHCTRVLYIYN